MSYYIIIRGPLGIGKTTISKLLSKQLKAKYFSMDKILSDNNLDKRGKEPCIPVRNFIKANNIILPEIKKALKNKKIVILDGCFYHKEQISHLEKSLKFKQIVFDLKAPVEVCINRDSKRSKVYGQGAAHAVYNLVSRFNYGIVIDTNRKNKNQVVKEILNRLPKIEN
ncbi:MAG: AAA family ATPase [Nanoarchaeota archaeon]